ncbi:MAG: hypothetical protein EHM45_08210 [Desulfobacteraceae bacterium]|nr:MAG: hypothetical protein EHM45_08210 [Desulfobacteraceae bacterium]
MMLKSPKRIKHHFIFLFFLFLLPVLWVQAADGIVYKEPRPLRGGPVVESKAASIGTYLYDPTGKTDPFKSFISDEVIDKPGKASGGTLTILETLDLSQLELIAIMVGPKGNWAMVRDSKGVGHVIKKGTPIGTKGGVVDKITEHEVFIKEEFKDFRGNKQYKETVKKTPSSVQ